MNRFILAAGLLLLPVLATSSASAQTAARNYDCSKAGNANKTVCKNAAAAAAAARPAPKPAATRNYDCSKAGNANKAVCKAAAAPAPKPATTRNYDCSKAGNANKTVCKGAASAPATTASRQAPRAAPAPASRPASVAGENTNPGGPGGATAKCKDGTMSFSAHRSGTCSRHGGVAQWF